LSFFPTVYSLLSREAILLHIKDNNDIQSPVSFQYFLRGMNDTYVLVTEQTKYIFRAYRADMRNKTAEFRLAREIHSRHNKEEVEMLREASLNGYRDVRYISENDIKVVPIFVAIRQLWLFALCFSEAELIGEADFDCLKDIIWLKKPHKEMGRCL
jgi:Ser/Thr protein kinase RdoA (MazF antagonist)